MKFYGVLCALTFTLAGCSHDPPPTPASNSPFSGSPPNSQSSPVSRNQVPSFPPAPAAAPPIQQPPASAPARQPPSSSPSQPDTFAIQDYIGGIKQIRLREMLVSVRESAIMQTEANHGRYQIYDDDGSVNSAAVDDFRSDNQRSVDEIAECQRQYNLLPVPAPCNDFHVAYGKYLNTELQCLNEYKSFDFTNRETGLSRMTAMRDRFSVLSDAAAAAAQSALVSLSQQYRIPLDFSIGK